MARDPDRIAVICGKLARLWTKYPDMRFFQMIEEIHGGVCDNVNQDPFHIEDGLVLKTIQTLLTNGIGECKVSIKVAELATKIEETKKP